MPSNSGWKSTRNVNDGKGSIQISPRTNDLGACSCSTSPFRRRKEALELLWPLFEASKLTNKSLGRISAPHWKHALDRATQMAKVPKKRKVASGGKDAGGNHGD